MAVTEKGGLGSKGTGGGSFRALSLTESVCLSCRKIRDTEGLNCALEPWRSQVVLCPGPRLGLSVSVTSTYLLPTWDVRARDLKLLIMSLLVPLTTSGGSREKLKSNSESLQSTLRTTGNGQLL